MMPAIKKPLHGLAIISLCIAMLTDQAFAEADRGVDDLGHAVAIKHLQMPRKLDAAFVQVPLAQDGSRIRFLFRMVTQGTGSWTVVFADLHGNTVESIKASDFSAGKYWTKEVPSGAAQARIQGADPTSNVEIAAYSLDVSRAQQQGVIGTDNSREILNPATPALARTVAAPIARLIFLSDGSSCTGFLLGRDLLMTNNHCISADTEIAATRVQFGADDTNSAITELKVSKIEATSKPLDYTVLRLTGDVSRLGRLHVGGPVAARTQLLLVQHPDGKIKKAAFPPDCAVGTALALGVSAQVDFGHNCDTLGGSSGSPVLDWTQRRVVGLHHWTYLKGKAGSLNQAVHIRFIVDDLRRLVQKRQLSKAILDELVRPQE